MDINHNQSYRQLARLAELKANNENNKRFFGRDITNLDKRIKKNVSIYEKLPIVNKVETKCRSRSLYGHKEVVPPVQSHKDAIHEYKQDVIDFMAKLQKSDPADNQKQVTDKMRQILIDWMIDVHDSFQLKEQTLYLALSYLADYSALREITKEDYQLAGISCLWIASKYEEIYPPRTRNYVEVTAETYTVKDLKNMEGNIINALNFDLNRTTALQMMESMIENNEGMTDKALCLCKYAMELAIFEGLAKKYSPQTMVMAALALVDNVLKIRVEPKLQPSVKVSKTEMMECFKEMCFLMQGNNKYDLTALRRKYAKSRNHQVSKIRLTIAE